MKDAGWPPDVLSYQIMLEGYLEPWPPRGGMCVDASCGGAGTGLVPMGEAMLGCSDRKVAWALGLQSAAITELQG